MKKTFSIIVKICSFLILILSLVMMFIEGRIIVSLEWTVYDSFFNGLFRYLLRFLLAGIFLFVSMCELFNLYKNSNEFKLYISIAELVLVITTIFMNIYFTNYIDIISFRLMLILITFKALYEYSHVENKKEAS